MAELKNSTQTKGFKHLSYNERSKIEILHKQGYSNREIGRELGRHHTTIKNELERGTTTQIKGSNQKEITVYFADTGQSVYEKNRQNSIKRYKLHEVSDFIDWAESILLSDTKWSPDAICSSVRQQEHHDKSTSVCTKTLYNYIDQGLMTVKNIDLHKKVSLNTKTTSHRKNKTILGTSIEERPSEVTDRQSFGHWEIDCVVGEKNKEDDVLLTLVERTTRFGIVKKLDGKDADSVSYALSQIKAEFKGLFNSVFLSITADNGSEFAGLTEQFKNDVTAIYFAHPYSSFERGTNEHYNGILRRYIPKGIAISNYSRSFIQRITNAINAMPRKILGYYPAQEAFELALAHNLPKN